MLASFLSLQGGGPFILRNRKLVKEDRFGEQEDT